MLEYDYFKDISRGLGIMNLNQGKLFRFANSGRQQKGGMKE